MKSFGIRPYATRYGEFLLAPATLAVCVAAIALLAMAGPFGTFGALEAVDRTIYWTVVVIVSVVIGGALETIREVRFPGMRTWLRCAAMGLAMGVAFTPFLAAITWFYARPASASISYPALFVDVVVISCVITLFRTLAEPKSAKVPETEPSPRLAKRVGVEDPSDIRHVTVSDHYVRVVTTKGVEKVLMRFSDAVEDLRGVHGMQVHRSHWVAKAAVDHVKAEGGRTSLVLDCGREIPVSRKFVSKAVKLFADSPGRLRRPEDIAAE